MIFFSSNIRGWKRRKDDPPPADPSNLEKSDTRTAVFPLVEPASQETVLKEEVFELYSTLSRQLLSYARTFGSESEGAQDAVQEAFLRYFIYRSTGAEVLNKKAWLYKVLRNFLLDRGKESYSRNKVDLEEIAHWPDQGQNPEKSLQDKEKYHRLLQALSPRELECLRLKAEGFDYQEMADLMNIRIGTVGALLARALQKIQKRN